jgi:uncharacterized protein
MSVHPATTARYLLDRQAEHERLANARAERLRAALPQAKECLARFGAKRVWLFGSLVTGEVDLRSDVDLAVTGIATTDHMAALAELMTLFAGPVDLVRMEEAAPGLQERVLTEGQEL